MEKPYEHDCAFCPCGGDLATSNCSDAMLNKEIEEYIKYDEVVKLVDEIKHAHNSHAIADCHHCDVPCFCKILYFCFQGCMESRRTTRQERAVETANSKLKELGLSFLSWSLAGNVNDVDLKLTDERTDNSNIPVPPAVVDDIIRYNIVGKVCMLKAGWKVKGLYRGCGEKWHPGVIAAVLSDGTYNVDYDDGEKDLSLTADQVVAVAEVVYTGRKPQHKNKQLELINHVHVNKEDLDNGCETCDYQ